MLNIAMISYHTCPLATLGGKDTGGMNVYVRDLTIELGRMCIHVDVFTRSQDEHVPHVLHDLGYGNRVVHVQAGPEVPCPKPEVASYIKGIINLRGKIIPVLDVRLRFHKAPADYTDRTCIIVIEHQDQSVGLIVDQVAEVLTIEDECIVPPPEFAASVQNHYIRGIGKVGGDVKLLLDCDQFFTQQDAQVPPDRDS
jgi:chemotaxis signal transduction protein